MSGYRIVLVEDVGELYPDVSYRLRNRIPDPVQTPTASNQDLSRAKVCCIRGLLKTFDSVLIFSSLT